MGADSSKARRPGGGGTVPAIRLPASTSFTEERGHSVEELRPRTGSQSSPRHSIPLKTRRFIQGCFVNPHETIGRRTTKRACESKKEFCTFFLALDHDTRDEFDENIKTLLKRTVGNIDTPDEVERIAEEFGRCLVPLRANGFKPDMIAAIADACMKECTHLDSAVHKAHTTTQAFALFGSMVFSSVRDGFYLEVRRKRRTSNSFSTGSTGSRRKKSSVDSQTERTSPKGSPRSLSPESHYSEDAFYSPDGDDGFLKPPAPASAPIIGRSF